MRFEWDARRAAANLLKHGIQFDDAIIAFDDPWALRAPDTAHSKPGEKRIWLIGESDSAVVVVVFTRTAAGPGNANHQRTTGQSEGANAI